MQTTCFNSLPSIVACRKVLRSINLRHGREIFLSVSQDCTTFAIENITCLWITTITVQCSQNPSPPGTNVRRGKDLAPEASWRISVLIYQGVRPPLALESDIELSGNKAEIMSPQWMVKVSTNFSGNFHIFLRRHHSAKILSDGYLLTKSPFGEVEDKRPKFRIEFSRNFVYIFNSQGSNQAHSATHWGPFQLRHLDIYCNPALYPLHLISVPTPPHLH